LTLPDLLRRRLALVLLPVVFAASFALAQTGADRAGADKRRSGYQDMGAALQKMQDDDSANPGMLFVQLGQQLWSKPAGAANKGCADCHSIADMKGVAARYPAMVGGKLTTLEQQVRHKGASARLREPRFARVNRLCGAAISRHAHCC
jgi:sulfur-oxidizing protein SoxA